MTDGLSLCPFTTPDTVSSGILKQRLSQAFGGLAANLGGPIGWSGPSGGSEREVWSRAVAEELLLARLCGLEVHPSWLVGFSGEHPFAGERETLAELWEKVAWVVVVPVHRPGLGTGTMIRVWGLRGADDSKWAEGADDLPFGRFSIRLGGWSEPIAGRSWQLGAALADRIADHRRADLQLELARHWLVTGAMDGGNHVMSVTAGNKVCISTRRRWLVPEACHGDFKAMINLRAAATLDAAWSHLSGEGMIADGVVAWPQPAEITSFHATVGQAVLPIVGSILNSRPSEVVLWHSGNKEVSTDPAELIAEFLNHPVTRSWQGWQGSLPRIELKPAPSDDLVEAERAYRKAGLDQIPARGVILCNITGGTRIMGFAMANIARLNPAIWIIYRPETGADSDPAEVILIRNAGAVARTGRMKPARRPEGVNWNFISKRWQNTGVDDLVAGVFGSAALPEDSLGNSFGAASCGKA